MPFEAKKPHQVPLDPTNQDHSGMNDRKKACVDAKLTPERKNTHDTPEEPSQWP
jgi:hypothetical protein